MPTYEAETVRFQSVSPEEVNGARSWYARAQRPAAGSKRRLRQAEAQARIVVRTRATISH